MGNQIVTPSMGNWYHGFLKQHEITLKHAIESGTFFLTLDCVDKANNPIIVKAYEYCSRLDEINIVSNCLLYFKILRESEVIYKGITGYDEVYIQGNYAFLIRPKFEFTLAQRMVEYPPLEDVEKQWIAYRIITSIRALHSADLVHGSLNPDNIFVNWGLDVSISDVAPFKPSYIRSDKPHLFHHYFTTASRGHCYLAPERIMKPSQNSDNVFFQVVTFGMDLFSVGCVLYYLYTGNELFTFHELTMYANGELDIKERFELLPLYIRPLVVGLLSLKPSARLTVIENLNRYFPMAFGQISDQFLEFFHGDTRLDHLLQLIPAFMVIMDTSPNDVRLLFVNVFCHFLMKGTKVQEIVSFASFITDFSSTLGDEVKLNRILPYFCALLKLPSNLVKANALSCIYELIKSIDSLPQGFEYLFSAYLIPQITKSGTAAPQQYRVALAALCPALAFEIHRLAPDLMHDAIKMFNFVIREDDSVVLTSFIEMMIRIAKSGCKRNLDDHVRPRKRLAFGSKHKVKEVITDNVFPSAMLDVEYPEEDSDDIFGDESSTEQDERGTKSRAGYALRKSPSDSQMPEFIPEKKDKRVRSKSDIHFQMQKSIHGIGSSKKIVPEQHCNFDGFCQFFPVLMSALNSTNTKFKSNILVVFELFFENAIPKERRAYRNLFLVIVPTVLGFIASEKTPSMIASYLSFMYWCLFNRVLHESHMSEVISVISSLRRSEDPAIRYLSSKIISLLPKSWDNENLASFIWQIMTRNSLFVKQKSAAKPPPPQNRNLPLIYRKGITLSPNFLQSQRISSDSILASAGHSCKDIVAVVSDASCQIHSVRSNFEVQAVLKTPKPIVQMAELRLACGTAMTDAMNRLMFYDWGAQRPIYTKISFESRVASLISRERNIFFSFTRRGNLYLLDTRVLKPTNRIRFDKQLTGISLCAWDNRITLAAGFEEGNVTLIDTRMMLPVKSIQTEVPLSIVPVARNACNFAVASHSHVACYDALLGEAEMDYLMNAPLISGFDGNVVAVNDSQVSFIDCENFEDSMVLFDQRKFSQMDVAGFHPYVLRNIRTAESCLHKHSAPIKTLANSKGLFVSGDATGCLNFWSISK